jgi:hypothetical protein
MSDLVCPHCYTEVPRGASVCRGCQAEIEYGTPAAAIVAVAIASLFLAIKTVAFIPDSLSFLPWVVGIGSFIAGSIFCFRFYEDRVVFRRATYRR